MDDRGQVRAGLVRTVTSLREHADDAAGLAHDAEETLGAIMEALTAALGEGTPPVTWAITAARASQQVAVAGELFTAAADGIQQLVDGM